jgi:hypothetical protein
MTNVIALGGSRYIVSESAIGAGSVTGYVTGPATSRTADANLACPNACGALYCAGLCLHRLGRRLLRQRPDVLAHAERERRGHSDLQRASDIDSRAAAER